MPGGRHELADGYTPVPPGKIAAVVTYLEMTQPPAAVSAPLPPGFFVRPLGDTSPGAYRELFRAVGGPWLWFSRLRMTDTELVRVLHDPRVEVHLLERDGQAVGFLELDRRESPDVEISFLGVTPDIVGTGAGAGLMGVGLHRAWAASPRRVVLHTCSLDHPRALAFYLRMGFRAYRRAVEVADDPRVLGLLPRDAAPHVPIIEP